MIPKHLIKVFLESMQVEHTEAVIFVVNHIPSDKEQAKLYLKAMKKDTLKLNENLRAIEILLKNL